jgi:hypothetical protein
MRRHAALETSPHVWRMWANSAPAKSRGFKSAMVGVGLITNFWHIGGTVVTRPEVVIGQCSGLHWPFGAFFPHGEGYMPAKTATATMIEDSSSRVIPRCRSVAELCSLFRRRRGIRAVLHGANSPRAR